VVALIPDPDKYPEDWTWIETEPQPDHFAFDPSELIVRDYVSRLWATDWDSVEDSIYDDDWGDTDGRNRPADR
jgi:hypothetical protein